MNEITCLKCFQHTWHMVCAQYIVVITMITTFQSVMGAQKRGNSSALGSGKVSWSCFKKQVRISQMKEGRNGVLCLENSRVYAGHCNFLQCSICQQVIVQELLSLIALFLGICQQSCFSPTRFATIYPLWKHPTTES